MPSSAITAIASGRTWLGRVPALNTAYRSPPRWRHKPSAIWLRAELPVHRISTRCLSAPTTLVTARRTAARGRGLLRADEGAHEFPVNLGRDGVHVHAFGGEELARVGGTVDARGLHLN